MQSVPGPPLPVYVNVATPALFVVAEPVTPLFGPPQSIVKVTTTFGAGVADGGAVVTVAVTVCAFPTGFVAVAGPSEMLVGQPTAWIRPIELLK